MYEDDRFNPAYNADVNELDEFDKKKTANKLLKTTDVNHVRCRKDLVKEVTKKNGAVIKVTKPSYFDLYGSGDIGCHIRHAITGFRTPHIVGSKDEDLYYVISDARGLTGTQNPLTLFFDSPEQYEKHCFTVVPQNIKDKWSKKFMEARNNVE
jgi:hypothetical protein